MFSMTSTASGSEHLEVLAEASIQLIATENKWEVDVQKV